jgi:hypothetical protein
MTCVCVVGEDAAWTFTYGPHDDHAANDAAVMILLDAAPIIYAFNGGEFDLPFIRRCTGASDARLGGWMAKLVDPLYSARNLLGSRACARLAEILALNGLESKTASGADAVGMAARGEWDRLAAYCMQDTRLTFALLWERRVYWTDGLQYDARIAPERLGGTPRWSR